MRYVNALLNSLCDLVLLPFRGESAWLGIIAAALVTAAVFIGVFRSWSDQRALRRKKGQMLARALELLLFRHDLIVGLTAFGRMAKANGGYFRQLLKPVAVALVPSVLVLIQLAGWYEHRPFAVGDPVLVSVDFREDAPVMDQPVELQSSEGLTAETEGLRIPALNQMSWRLRAESDGTGWVDVLCGGRSVRKEVVVGGGTQRISGLRVQAGFWNELLHPGEPPIPGDSPVERIIVRVPKRQLFVGDVEIHWLVAYLVLTMVFGLALGRLLRISF